MVCTPRFPWVFVISVVSVVSAHPALNSAVHLWGRIIIIIMINIASGKGSEILGKVCGNSNSRPDPPILAFFDFLAFFVFRFSLLFCAFFLSFPRILGVPRKEKPLLLGEKHLLFPQKSKGWRVRAEKFAAIFLQ